MKEMVKAQPDEGCGETAHPEKPKARVGLGPS